MKGGPLMHQLTLYLACFAGCGLPQVEIQSAPPALPSAPNRSETQPYTMRDKIDLCSSVSTDKGMALDTHWIPQVGGGSLMGYSDHQIDETRRQAARGAVREAQRIRVKATILPGDASADDLRVVSSVQQFLAKPVYLEHEFVEDADYDLTLNIIMEAIATSHFYYGQQTPLYTGVRLDGEVRLELPDSSCTVEQFRYHHVDRTINKATASAYLDKRNAPYWFALMSSPLLRLLNALFGY